LYHTMWFVALFVYRARDSKGEPAACLSPVLSWA
jgi:hypothetical protein